MSGEQPEYVWDFGARRRRPQPARVWLIVAIVTAVVIVAALLVFHSLSHEPAPVPGASASPSPRSGSTPTSTPTPTASPSGAPEPTPSSSPDTTPPPAPDPDLESFTAQVRPRLDDAVRGLDLIQSNMDVGAQIVDSLQKDAEVLSDSPAPSALSAEWGTAVTRYASTLADLRAAFDDGSDPQNPLSASHDSLSRLRAVVGL